MKTQIIKNTSELTALTYGNGVWHSLINGLNIR